ncbi:FAD-binding oxidoreductase [Aliikangiella sp. IMCC44653]
MSEVNPKPISLQQLKQLSSWSTRKTLLSCVNVIQETVDVKTFQLRALDDTLFHFKPGQFVGIQLEIDGVKHNRSYTIASAPTRPHLLELTIKLDPTGVVSPWLHENLKPGSQLEVRGPAGRFNCDDIESDKVLLISAGSGITPMMSMLRYWSDLGLTKDIVFINWARSTQDIIFRRELGLIDFQWPNINLEIVCTQPGLSENWLGRRGRVNANLLSDVVPDLNERTVFCCGPEGFMQQVQTSLDALGFDLQNYHDESFDPGGKKKAKMAEIKQLKNAQIASAQEQPANPGPFQLTLKKTGKAIQVETSDNLLETLESAGVEMESACRAGNCGSCQVKMLSGKTNSFNAAGLHSDRKIAGYILTCTTNVLSDCELDI